MSLSVKDRLGLVQEILNFETDFRIFLKTEQQENTCIFISQSVCVGGGEDITLKIPFLIEKRNPKQTLDLSI